MPTDDLEVIANVTCMMYHENYVSILRLMFGNIDEVLQACFGMVYHSASNVLGAIADHTYALCFT